MTATLALLRTFGSDAADLARPADVDATTDVFDRLEAEMQALPGHADRIGGPAAAGSDRPGAAP